ncbi:hypothetical protein SAMN05444358_101117 [Ruegeria halocynthiae]|uniref:Sulphur transport domain-containing protein n=1 Tax=Ruegeria halocynthiae TaxID=985054 RepID=A0A1H2RCL3_9RHOB|nr:DUF6691 family protein [Ruegeria halocynthiae]SDW17206.1 hypothetical protein SAMN05444358_101117 [Ruegeria halocynthiae]
MRAVFAFFAGSLFGIGLLISGMTDTTKVQGWLDVFGNWDPTLAFVMGGAILPMLVAWQLTRNRAPLVGGQFPAPPRVELDRRLIVGSVLFGVGWGLAGLCPGPAMASLGYGGVGGVIFLIAMIAGMFAAPKLGAQLDRMANAA